MTFRKATETDIAHIAKIYSDIHTEEESGNLTVGWTRDVYPTRQTAQDALQRDDLFVGEEQGKIFGAAIINRTQVDAYKDAPWAYPAENHQITVLHTLVISPEHSGNGYGKAFVRFYEEYALANNAPYLRMDTNARNVRARAMYKKLGYREIGIVPCVFNGIEGVELVLLEKNLNISK